MTEIEQRDRHNRLAAIGALTCLLERPDDAMDAQSRGRVEAVRSEMIDAIWAQTEAVLAVAHLEDEAA